MLEKVICKLVGFSEHIWDNIGLSEVIKHHALSDLSEVVFARSGGYLFTLSMGVSYESVHVGGEPHDYIVIRVIDVKHNNRTVFAKSISQRTKDPEESIYFDTLRRHWNRIKEAIKLRRQAELDEFAEFINS